MKVGLIGFGRLGSFLAKYLAADTDLYVHDINPQNRRIKALGATPASLEEIAGCRMILMMVPMSELEKTCQSLAPYLGKDNLVVDVCSVKTKPVEIMQKTLPEDCQILGTHPMFGPDSAALTLFGSKIVLTPVRIEDHLFQGIANYLRSHGLKVIEASAEEHDRQISRSLLLTHLIGRTLMSFGAEEQEIDTKGYRRLMKILGVVENDSWQLFEDMNALNPYAKETRDLFVEHMKDIISKVEND